jgi:gliding motility-associated-like protein
MSTVSSGCPASIVAVSDPVSGSGCDKEQTFHVTATDACGNSTTQTVTYSWVESPVPVISSLESDTDFGCVVPSSAPVFAVTDACTVSPVAHVVTTGAVSADGCSYSQTWTASYQGVCGQWAVPVKITYRWTVNDKPLLSGTGDYDYGCVSFHPTDIPSFSVVDNCDVNAVVTDIQVIETNDGCNYQKVWKANYINACGISADEVEVVYTWTIKDKPVIVVANNGTHDFGCTIPAVIPEFEVIDNCKTDAIVTNIITTPIQTLDGCTYTQSWIANYVNMCGVPANPVMVTYTWKENPKPVISLVFNGDRDYGCVDIAPVDVPYFIVSDNCDWGATVTDYSSEETNNGCEYTRVWTARYENDCKVAADSVSVTYTWTLRNKPVISVINGSQDFGCAVPDVTPVFTVIDECGSAQPIPVNDVVEGPIVTLNNCTYSQTWTANYRSACGVSADPVIVTYTWQINPLPVITVVSHGDKDYGCINREPIDRPVFSVSDNCDLGALVNVIYTESNIACEYTKVWTATYTNTCGMEAVPVNVVYKWTLAEKPVITVTANGTYDYGCVTEHPENIPTFEVSDMCGIPTDIEITGGEVQSLDNCTYSRVWTANYLNACGNSAETVVVTHTWTLDVKPVLSSTGDRNFGNVLNAPVVSPSFTVLDNCSGSTLVNDVEEGAAKTTDGYTYTKTWTANYINSCGTSADPLTVIYTWRLNASPVIYSDGDVDFGCVTEAPTEIPKFTAVDGCDPIAIVTDIQEGEIETWDDCVFTKTWTANYRSNCGIAPTVKVTYTWTLDTKPVITTSGNKYFHKVDKEPTEAPIFIVEDNCNWLAHPDIEESEPQSVNNYTFIKTWTANYTNTCGTAADQVVTMYRWTLASGGLEFPPYFTPNGDGINDTWEIKGLKELYPDAEVNIYDRFGRRLLTYRGDEVGWDGYYRGSLMPGTDYWYTVRHNELPDREISGHFTLLR